MPDRRHFGWLPPHQSSRPVVIWLRKDYFPIAPGFYYVKATYQPAPFSGMKGRWPVWTERLESDEVGIIVEDDSR